MKLRRVTRTSEESSRELYTIVGIIPDDIPEPSKNMRRVIRELDDLPFLNDFTIDEFVKQVRNGIAHDESSKE